MCGIVGFIDTSLPKKEVLKENGIRMSKAIQHRGPDDSGIWLDESLGISFAHKRLSIIELSNNGHQPMISNSGRFVIVFNGEIYNHMEIRKKINAKSKNSNYWRGRSDTETIIEAIEIFGLKETLELCVGMFAFAVWDRKDKLLHLARDRFGEKPIYWGLVKNKFHDSSTFIFSSELSAIWESSYIEKSINENALTSYFNYGYVKPPQTIQNDIFQLLPGEFLSINYDDIRIQQNDPPRPEKWWDALEKYLSINKFNYNYVGENEIINGLEKILEESIILQSNADVSLGAFLSGGIDSSLVATILQKNSSNKIKTFNVSFPDIKNNESIIDEGPFAKAIANHIGSEHIEIALREKESLDIIENISSYFSEPFADSSQIPSFLVCKEAKKIGLSVAMSGDGGDELFGGYNRHSLIPKINNFFGIMPKGLIDNFILPNIDNKFIEFLISKEKSQKLFSSIKASKNVDKMYDNLTMTGLNNLYKLTNNNDYLNEYSKNYEIIRDLSERIMMKDLNTYLPFDILVKMDRASMANSLETRAPFLDHRVVEYSWKIPIRNKINQSIFLNSGKLPLKKILKKYFPNKFFNRRKNGFSIPLNSWLKGPLKSWATDIINPLEIKNQGYIDENIVCQIWDDHIKGIRDNSNKLWTILMWQEWLRNWHK